MSSCRGLRFFLSLLAWGLLITGCDHGPSLHPLAPGATVVAFGDSLTYGTGAGKGESYPARLAILIDHRVVNAGIPGELSSEGLKRLPQILDTHKPSLLVLCHGGNDLLRRQSDATVSKNIRAMIEISRERGIAVILVGVPKPNILLSSAGFYEEIATEFDIPYAGEILPDILSERTLKSDTIHPNARGYARLAECLAELLENAGAV